ncbi:MAG: hypothetical protein Q9198_004123 [Flavoplaca austrocitrina]
MTSIQIPSSRSSVDESGRTTANHKTQSSDAMTNGVAEDPRPKAMVRSRLDWTAASRMAYLLVAGVIIAAIHHLFYSILDGKHAHSGASSWDTENQAWSVRIGTALALLAKSCLAGAVAMAYQQHIWSDFRNKDYTLHGIGVMFEAVNNVCSAFSWEILMNAKIATLLAMVIW